MGTAAVNLKVIVGVAQESGSAIDQMVADLSSIVTAVKNLGAVSLQSIADQIRSISDAAQSAAAQITPLVDAVTDTGTTGGPSSAVEDVAPQAEDAGDSVEKLKEELEKVKLELEKIKDDDSFKKVKHEVEETGFSLHEAEHFIAEFFSTLREGAEFFLAMEVVKTLREWGEEAAKTQLLAKAMELLGEQSGLSAKEVKEIDESIQKLGITAEASRSTLNKLLISGVQIGKESAVGLGEAAKELSRITAGALSSDQALEQLGRAIERGSTALIQREGFRINETVALYRYAQAHETVVSALTKEEKSQAILNAVVDFGAKNRKILAATAGEAAVSFAALSNAVTALKEALGNYLTPALQVLAVQAKLFVDDLREMAGEEGQSAEFAKNLAESVSILANALRATLEFIARHHDAIVTILEVWGAAKLASYAVELGVRGLLGTVNLATLAVEAFNGASVALAAGIGGELLAALLVIAAPLAAFVALAEKYNGLDKVDSVTRSLVGAVIEIGLHLPGVKKTGEQKSGAEKVVEGETPEDTVSTKDQEAAMAKYVEARKKLLSGNDQAIEQMSNFKALLKGFTGQTKDASVTTTEMSEALRKVTETIKTPEALKDFIQLVKEYTAAGGKGGATAIAVATENVRKQNLAFTAELVAQKKAQVAAEGEALSIGYKFQSDQLKQFNEQRQKEDDESYKKGEIQLADYFERKRNRIKEEGVAEIAVQRQALANAEAEYRFANTRAEKEQAQNKIQTEANKLGLLVGPSGSIAGKVGAVNLDEDKAREQLKDRINKLLAQASAIEDGEPGKIQKINEQYKQQIEAVADIGEKKALEAVRDSEIAKLKEDDAKKVQQLAISTTEYYGGLVGQIEAINQKYKELERTLRGVQGAAEAIAAAKEVDLEKAAIDNLKKSADLLIASKEADLNLTKAQIAAAYSRGQINDAERLERENDAIREQINVVKLQVSEKENLIQINEKDLQARIDLLKVQNNPQTGLPFTEEEIKNQTQAIRDQIQSLENDATGLQAKLIELGASIKSYGDQIRQGFTENLSNAFKEMITGAKSAGDAFQQFAKNMRDQIAGIFAKNLAENFTARIVEITSKKYPAGTVNDKGEDIGGKIIPGSSIFDIFGKALGKTAQLGTKSNPMYVQDVDADKHKTAGTATVTTGAGLPIGPDGRPIYPPGRRPWDEKGPLGESTVPEDPISQLFSLFKKKKPAKKPVELSNEYEDFPDTSVPTAQRQNNEFGDFPGELAKVPSDIVAKIDEGSKGMFASLKGGFDDVFKDIGSVVSNIGDIGKAFGIGAAEGGQISGPGTGTSDSIPAMLSDKEYVMPADKTSRFLPLLDAMRSGKLSHLREGGLMWDGMPMQVPSFAMGGPVQSIAIPDRLKFAEGGAIGAGSANVNPGLPSLMQVMMHPDTVNMTMQDFFEREITRQFSRKSSYGF